MILIVSALGLLLTLGIVIKYNKMGFYDANDVERIERILVTLDRIQEQRQMLSPSYQIDHPEGEVVNETTHD